MKVAYEYLSIKERFASANAKSDLKKQCKQCGRKKVIPVYVDRLLCDWCGSWIYRTPSIEFKYKLEKEMKRNV